MTPSTSRSTSIVIPVPLSSMMTCCAAVYRIDTSPCSLLTSPRDMASSTAVSAFATSSRSPDAASSYSSLATLQSITGVFILTGTVSWPLLGNGTGVLASVV